MLKNETGHEVKIAQLFIRLLINIIDRNLRQIDDNKEYIGDVFLELLRELREYLK